MTLRRSLLAVVPDVKPEPPAPFWALCQSLRRRQKQVTAEHYLGCVEHLARRFVAIEGNEHGGHLYSVLNRGMVASEVIDGCRDVARLAGDKDATALADLLLTLTDEQREALC